MNLQVAQIVFENSFCPIAWLDQNMNFIRVNEVYARYIGKPADEFIGKNHFEMFPNEDNFRIFYEVLQTQKMHTAFAKEFQYEYQPELGLTYWHWTLSPVVENGQSTGVLLFLFDVTDNIRLKNSLATNEAILHFTDDLFLIVDQELKIRFASKYLFHHKQEEVLHKDLLLFLAGEEKEIIRDLLHLCQTQHKAEEAILLIKNVWYWFKVFPIAIDKIFRSYIIQIVDISKQQRHLIELETAHREKNETLKQKEFISSLINHEFRNIVNATGNLVELINLDGLGDGNLELLNNLSKQLRQVVGQTEHLLNIGDAKHFSRKDRFNLLEMIQEIIMLNKPLLKSGVEILSDCAKMPAHFTGNYLKTKEVFANIISNAVKYTNAGQIVIRLRLNNSNDRIYAEISDSGVGIESDNVEKIFHSYFREKRSENLASGLGYGLHIVKKNIEALNGNITLKSKLNVGTTFYFDIPIIPCQNWLLQKPSSYFCSQCINEDSKSSDLSTIKPFLIDKKILCVEDDPNNMLLLTTMLKRLGVDNDNLLQANYAWQVEEQLQNHFDIVILDLYLPDKSALDLISSIKKKDVKILIVSAEIDSNIESQALSLGADALLTKPFSMQRLADEISRLIQPL